MKHERLIGLERWQGSQEILELFAAVCRFAGLEPRLNRRSVRIYRRASVAPMREHVGLKT